MNSSWASTQEKAWHAVSMKNWREAERHFRKAVKQTADFHPAAHFVALCDHALSLKMVGRLDEFEQARDAIRQLALSKFGVPMAGMCERLFDAADSPSDSEFDTPGCRQCSAPRGYPCNCQWDTWDDLLLENP